MLNIFDPRAPELHRDELASDVLCQFSWGSLKDAVSDYTGDINRRIGTAWFMADLMEKAAAVSHADSVVDLDWARRQENETLLDLTAAERVSKLLAQAHADTDLQTRIFWLCEGLEWLYEALQELVALLAAEEARLYHEEHAEEQAREERDYMAQLQHEWATSRGL